MVTFGTLWLDSQPGELHHTRQSRAGGEAGALYRVNQPLALRADGGRGPSKSVGPITKDRLWTLLQRNNRDLSELWIDNQGPDRNVDDENVLRKYAYTLRTFAMRG